MARFSKNLLKIKEQGLGGITIGFNCDLTDQIYCFGDFNSSSIIFGLFNDDYVIALKTENFTYVHN